MCLKQQAKVGCPQISSANRKSADLLTLIICKISGLYANETLCGLKNFLSFAETPEKFPNLRQRNAPKNLRICDLRTRKKLLAHLWQQGTILRMMGELELLISRFV